MFPFIINIIIVTVGAYLLLRFFNKETSSDQQRRLALLLRHLFSFTLFSIFYIVRFYFRRQQKGVTTFCSDAFFTLKFILHGYFQPYLSHFQSLSTSLFLLFQFDDLLNDLLFQ